MDAIYDLNNKAYVLNWEFTLRQHRLIIWVYVGIFCIDTGVFLSIFIHKLQFGADCSGL